MEDAIVEKLRQHLEHPINNECKVVYLLCEIRKLLEKQNPHPKPLALWLHCHWALHVDLSRPKTTSDFLERVDSSVYKQLYEPKKISILEEHRLFKDFIYFETFRAELAQFLSRHGIPTSLCNDEHRWSHFIASYASVIEDGSLTSGSAGDGLKIRPPQTAPKPRRGDRQPPHPHPQDGEE